MSDGDTSLRFALLGSLRVWRGSDELPTGAHQSRLALALLLARSGALVEVSELVDLLWPTAVPPTAVNMVHRYVGMLRRVLEPDLPARSGGRWLLRDVGGYRLVLTGASFDLTEFREQVAAARALGDQPAALDHLVDGLNLWRGGCAAGLGPAVEAHPDFLAIEREYLAAARDAAAIALRHGVAGRVLPVLRAAVTHDPLDEALQAQLVLALAADGNRSEAIAQYAAVRDQLAADLGVDPGPELHAAHQAVLRADQAATTSPAPVPATVVRPAQLPSDLHLFAGRQALLDDALAVLGAAGPAMPIVAFDGMPGVGKTTLAIHLAHRLAPSFSDGQLYADLCGFDARDRIADPADVLRSFLGALGVGPELIPASLDDRAALFRSTVAGRRLLIVLDNARDADQVRPLLPGTSPNAVVITSRGRLGRLATANGAYLHNVDVLTEPESRACLVARVGAARAAAEPDVLDQIIRWCGRLPLALAIVGARAGADPGRSLREIAAELRTDADLLTAFRDDGLDVDVRAVFTWSYRRISAGAARTLRLLPLHPGTDITAETAASLAGVPLTEARSHLAELVRTGLLTRYRPSRYRLHDLIRAFADELGRTHGAPTEQARLRIADHYLHTVYAAVRLVRPGFGEVDVPAVRSDVTVLELDDAFAARKWINDEQVTVRAVIADAAARRDAATCWKLALLAKDLYFHMYLWPEWATTAALALEAATEADDVTGMAQSHRSLAGARLYTGDTASAVLHLTAAAGLFKQLGDVVGQAEVLMNLGRVAHTRGEYATGIALLLEARPIFAAAGRRSHELNVLVMLADLYRLAGDDRNSWATALAGLRTARERDDLHKIENSLATIMRLETRRGHFVDALRICQYYIDSHVQRRSANDVATSLLDAGVILYEAGEVDDACHLWTRARSLTGDDVLRSYLNSCMSRESQAIYQDAVPEFPPATSAANK